MMACIKDGIFKTKDWTQHETEYVNDYFKKINIWDGITDQNMASFRETWEGLLFALDDAVINEEWFTFLFDLNTAKIWVILTGNIKRLI